MTIQPVIVNEPLAKFQSLNKMARSEMLDLLHVVLVQSVFLYLTDMSRPDALVSFYETL